MKILVVGGTGYIGRTLTRKLKEQGHHIRLMVRRNSEHKVDPNLGFEIVTGDVLDTQACLAVVETCDAVVNLVGILREQPQLGISYDSLHTSATWNLINACTIQKVERFVQMSALGVAPDARSNYHRTKWEAEEIVRRSDMRWTIFRPSIVFAPGDDFSEMLVDLVHRPMLPIIDGFQSKLQPVSLGNLTDGMARTLHMPETQFKVYEVGGPDVVVLSDLIDETARLYKIWPNTIKVSARMMRPAVKFLQRFPSFPLTVDMLEMLLQDNVTDHDEFWTTFGVSPKDSYLEAFPSLIESIKVA